MKRYVWQAAVSSLGCFVLAFVLTSDTPHLRMPAIALAIGIAAVHVAVLGRVRPRRIVNWALVGSCVWAVRVACAGEPLVAVIAFGCLAAALGFVRSRIGGAS